MRSSIFPGVGSRWKIYWPAFSVARVHTQLHTLTHTYTHTHILTIWHVNTHADTHTCTHTHANARTHECYFGCLNCFVQAISSFPKKSVSQEMMDECRPLDLEYKYVCATQHCPCLHTWISKKILTHTRVHRQIHTRTHTHTCTHERCRTHKDNDCFYFHLLQRRNNAVIAFGTLSFVFTQP